MTKRERRALRRQWVHQNGLFVVILLGLLWIMIFMLHELQGVTWLGQ